MAGLLELGSVGRACLGDKSNFQQNKKINRVVVVRAVF
jgi:hypothetical protein